MKQCPPEILDRLEGLLVDELLSTHAREQFRLGDIGSDELAPFIRALGGISERYNGHSVGQSIAQPIGSKVDAEAYALYYTLINAAKIGALASTLNLTSPQKVLDFGCGPATGIAALTAVGAVAPGSCGFEPNPWMRDVASRLTTQMYGLSPAPVIHSSQAGIGEGPFDLVIAANVLAEISDNAIQPTLDFLTARLAAAGTLLLIEPGQQLHTRRLMTYRDRLIEHDGLVPVFPCCRNSPCPMLSSSESDWCHGELRWERPRLISRIDRDLGFNKHRIKFSAFAFQRSGGIQSGYRVITPPAKGRVGTESMLCGADYFGLVRLTKKARSEQTRAFEKASVFDRLIIDGPVGPTLTGEAHVHNVE